MARGVLVFALIALAGCSSPPAARQYEVKGQILSINPERQEVLVNHEDIPGFMSAMTMPYKVNDPALLEGKQPGDLFTATLVVEEVNAYLSTLNKTGSAPIPDNSTVPLITAADLLDPGDVVPDQVLVDQDKLPRLMVSLRGHRVALTFMYTRCPLPEFCPRMDRNFAEVQAAIKADPALADVRLVSVTLDPAFDTPDVLKKHAEALKADPALWYFVTGDPQEVAAFSRAFGVTAEPGEPGAMMVHNLRTAVIDPDGRLVSVESGNMWTPAELVADLKAAPAPQR
jgi:protein SCO1/2